MAAPCNGGVAAACSDSDDHIRQVALTVAFKKVEAESNVYTLRRPDYTAEEWRFLYVTTGTDYYLSSIRLVGFCGVDGINWAVVTRMKEIDDSAREISRYFSERVLSYSALYAATVPVSGLFWTEQYAC
jgi:hypothetical protein